MEVVVETDVALRPLGSAGSEAPLVTELEHHLAEAQARRHRAALAQIAGYFPGLEPAVVDAGHGPPSHHPMVDLDPAATMAGIDEVLSGQDLVRRLEGFHDGSQQAIDVVFAPEPSKLVGPQVDPARLEEALAAGLTLRLNGVQPRLPQVEEICRQVSVALATLPNANVYLSGSTAPGLRPHVDSHDVFMVQVAGSKGWECGRSDRIPEAGFGGDSDLDTIEWAGTIQSGDGLHLPRGTVHRPIPDGSLSVHVSIGARRPAWSDLLAWTGAESSDVVHADVPAALVCGVASVEEVLGEQSAQAALRSLPPAEVEQALARYRFGLQTVRSASVGAARLAMASPASVAVRWCAPGGICVAFGHDAWARDRLVVGAAGRLLAIDPGDVEPLGALLEGSLVTSTSWAQPGAGERAVAMLSRFGLVEPVEFLE